MTFKFPRLFVVCLVLGLSTSTVFAQEANNQTSTLSATVSQTNGVSRLENDPIIISLAEPFTPAASSATTSAIATGGQPVAVARMNQMLLSAIDQRLGSPYVWGATGPRMFDCSGFVWSVYGSAGIRFNRSSARVLWSQFAPAQDDEKFRFGTLVFFNNQTHVGIVADERGFYHASTSKGVIYSPFSEYWTKRIDGFRRVPVAIEQFAD